MSTEFKIYTKTGDKGETSLIGGTRVPKYHDRIEAYGTLDELNSFIGLIRDQNIDTDTKAILIEIQDRIFTAESLLAVDTEHPPLRKLPELSEDDIVFLEKEIDRMNDKLPPIRNFILPGGHPFVSLCHIARTVCRRAERVTIKLKENYEVNELVIKYLNRLSDYLFVLSRKISQDFKADEIPWQARL
ncbi:MAG: cob(I)yrinic acid a,c-diamide adenosyltransferase [Sphingobacteriia bacterium]|nr:cob(I)yrinic acid a,c-diamide adenosyltransferase [Sphingobacteriia bacterium]